MGTTGGGGSGKFGTAMVQGDLARRGALNNVDTTMAQTAATLPMQAEQMGQGLLGMNMGSTSSTSGTSSSNGTQVGAGSPLAGAFQGGTASLYQTLQNLMLQGGM